MKYKHISDTNNIKSYAKLLHFVKATNTTMYFDGKLNL